MSLTDAIKSIPSWETKTSDELLVILWDRTVTATDSTLYTYAGLSTLMGLTETLQLRGTLKAILASGKLDQQTQSLLDFAHERLDVGGLDFSLAEVQGALESLRAVPALEPFIDSLKRVGVQVDHPYRLLTLQDVVDANVAAVALDDWKRAARVEALNRYNYFIAAIEVWDGSGDEPVL